MMLKLKTMRNHFSLSEGKLSIDGITLLSEIPNNVSFNTFPSPTCQAPDAPSSLIQQVQALSHRGGFLGFAKSEPSDRHMNSLGRFCARSFVSIFRFKSWWSTMWVGNSGSDLQNETMWVLLDVHELNSYVLILPIIEGNFRSAIYPGIDGHVMICAESGSTRVRAASFANIAYVHVCDNPYTLMKEAYSVVRVHLNTFRLVEEKSLPNIVDKFGWCTWDGFYLSVNPIGVWHGVKHFFEEGIPLRFLIIDDGWQSTNFDGENPFEDAKNLVFGGDRISFSRLYRFEECDKFKNYRGGSLLGPNAPSFDPKGHEMLISTAFHLDQAEKARDRAVRSGVADESRFESAIDKLRKELNGLISSQLNPTSIEYGIRDANRFDSEVGLKAFLQDLRRKFELLDDVYVWQALCGTWGGVRPGTTRLNSKVVPVKVPPGLDRTMTDLALVNLVSGGIGLVHPDQAADLYDSMHSYLAEVGITGVKVDVMHSLELVCKEYGGRVELAKAYYKGLTESLVKNFNGTGLLSSMQQCNDFFFLGTRQISLGRVGDDFWCRDQNGDPAGIFWLQGAHMIHCAYNSMWMGQIIQPDWDMFKSDHECAEFHAGSRAICGGPIYVSDSVGRHDFDLFRKLVHPDGTIPKCQHFALPTRDCLFKYPLNDAKTILKIWNLNKFGGVVGAFNCQGSGWDLKVQMIRGYPNCYKPISGLVHVHDIEWGQKEEAKEMGNAKEYAVYLNKAEKLLLTAQNSEAIALTLQPSSFEIFAFAPITEIGSRIKFAPVGLVNMFNSGGAILALENRVNGDSVEVAMKVKGEGKLLVYCSEKPKSCFLNGEEQGFEWLGEGEVRVDILWVEEKCGVSDVSFTF